jgi:hypothetical protein
MNAIKGLNKSAVQELLLNGARRLFLARVGLMRLLVGTRFAALRFYAGGGGFWT